MKTPPVPRLRRPWAAAAVAAVFFGLVLPFGLALFLCQSVFATRFTTGPGFDYRTEAFPGLVRTAEPFVSAEGRRLSGYLYRQAPAAGPKALVVLAHGFGGGGHRSYLPVVADLAAHGYLVFAYDATGSDESAGPGIGSLGQGPRDLEAALGHLRSAGLAQGKPVFLLGHSWGGFSVLSSLPRTSETVRAAVAAAAFNEAPAMLADAAEVMAGPPGVLLAPWLSLLDRWQEGSDAGRTAVAGLRASPTPVLLIHSQDDRTVPYRNLETLRRACSGRPSTEFWTLEGRGHDVFGPLALRGSVPAVPDRLVMDRILAFFEAHLAG